MVKRLPASVGDEGLIPGSGRSSREYEMIAHSSSLFLKKLIYFNWRIITLKYCGIFLIHGHESAMGAHVFSHSEPPLSPSSLPHPLGCPRAPALRILLHASNLH